MTARNTKWCVGIKASALDKLYLLSPSFIQYLTHLLGPLVKKSLLKIAIGFFVVVDIMDAETDNKGGGGEERYKNISGRG